MKCHVPMQLHNFFLCNGIRWPLFYYLHHNLQSLLIIFVHWTQLSGYWTHDTNYMVWIILVFFIKTLLFGDSDKTLKYHTMSTLSTLHGDQILRHPMVLLLGIKFLANLRQVFPLSVCDIDVKCNFYCGEKDIFIVWLTVSRVKEGRRV